MACAAYRLPVRVNSILARRPMPEGVFLGIEVGCWRLVGWSKVGFLLDYQ